MQIMKSGTFPTRKNVDARGLAEFVNFIELKKDALNTRSHFKFPAVVFLKDM